MNFGVIAHDWYKKNLRNLPWRQTRDPYLVWLSEVILQQTRVVQGLDYYKKFASAFPDLPSLAAAPEDQVLKLWQGLGYYSRARNMHAAAKELVTAHGGKMPASYEGLLAMKGVGTYTAAAVASICYGEEKAVVDGNVSRVLARLYGVEEAVNGTKGKRIVEQLAAGLMKESINSSQNISPGGFNQAIMEFGALLCTPRSPACEKCPLASACAARLSGLVDQLPLKTPKKKAEERWMYFYVFTGGGELILTRRDGPGIWRSLYHFPMLESPREYPAEDVLGKLLRQMQSELSISAEEPLAEGYADISGLTGPIKHQLTHLTHLCQLCACKAPCPARFAGG